MSKLDMLRRRGHELPLDRAEAEWQGMLDAGEWLEREAPRLATMSVAELQAMLDALGKGR